MIATDGAAAIDHGIQRYEAIPEHLRIKVLYEDEAVIVIDKPCNLRSVPGHAISPPPEPNILVRDSYDMKHNSHRSTAQESWALAIGSFQGGETDELAGLCLRRLAAMPNRASIPRKWGPFLRYCQRNQKRLAMDTMNQVDDKETKEGSSKTKRKDVAELDAIARKMHERIKRRQLPLMNLPQATRHEDSAYGQVILLRYADTLEESDASRRSLFVVHRLDCETSGVMVFARDKQAASKLCQAWRQLGEVSKIYLARVRNWPPFQNENQLEGRIDEPLAATEERLKWKVQTSGKPSTTLWKIRGLATNNDSDLVVLQLTPLTGRTHQLRVHCAHVGSGIEGDSLYGDKRIEWKPQQASAPVLFLHAHKLSFPHPRSGERMEFTSFPSWFEMIPRSSSNSAAL